MDIDELRRNGDPARFKVLKVWHARGLPRDEAKRFLRESMGRMMAAGPYSADDKEALIAAALRDVDQFYDVAEGKLHG